MDNVTVFDNFVAALRSGKYTKTTGALRKKQDGKDCFCALGVLADTVAPDAWFIDDENLGGDLEWDNKFSYEVSDKNFGKKITTAIWKMNDAGWNDVGAMFDDDYIKARPFEEIADWLEANREKILNGEYR